MDKLRIPPFSAHAAQAAQARMDALAKLPGSLGKLEALAVRLAGISATPAPDFRVRQAVLFAGDHAIARRGVTGSSQGVTAVQVRNFLAGGGAINAFCRTAGCALTVVDVGMLEDVDAPNLVRRKVVRGVRDFSTGPAMTREEARACLQVGVDMAREAAARGVNLLAAGEMGIGNTTAATAITAVLTGADVDMLAGLGDSSAPATTQRVRQTKARMVRQGIARNTPNPADALDVLASVGGAEIAAMAGLMLGGASLRIPVIVDGFIAGAAAAVAAGLAPAVAGMLVGSHLSREPGHRILMQYLNIPVYLELDMRLGEGTGAVLLMPLIDMATRILREMPTLEDLHIREHTPSC